MTRQRITDMEAQVSGLQNAQQPAPTVPVVTAAAVVTPEEMAQAAPQAFAAAFVAALAVAEAQPAQS